ncbi:hypothetical protein COCOBI_09-4140 [Coccomyxa sp. Obi]|nr:hypothetical protein COCOBI_09-4140 [Coccomyxa sp. Obi]
MNSDKDGAGDSPLAGAFLGVGCPWVASEKGAACQIPVAACAWVAAWEDRQTVHAPVVDPLAVEVRSVGGVRPPVASEGGRVENVTQASGVVRHSWCLVAAAAASALLLAVHEVPLVGLFYGHKRQLHLTPLLLCHIVEAQEYYHDSTPWRQVILTANSTTPKDSPATRESQPLLRKVSTTSTRLQIIIICCLFFLVHLIERWRGRKLQVLIDPVRNMAQTWSHGL